MLDRELYIFVEGFVTDVFSKLCGKKKVVFVVQSKMAAAGEAEATFFSVVVYFVRSSDLYRIGTINRELIASTFGRPPGWSVSQEVFAASSRLSTL